eukprot:c10258_g1_i2.p1 GENE.c10258_g1_i2~~c10258_g1_i2.p1  ORF type:complete len:350 (+),score=103.82 c10258_g1_i2:212-1261(+)
MSCCGGDVQVGDNVDKQISAFLTKQHKQDVHKIKLLLLGAGESGKSTIFKQMKILYGKPATNEERSQYTTVIFSNTIDAVQKLVEKAKEWGYDSEATSTQAMQVIESASIDSKIDTTIGDAIKAVWADPAIQKVWERRTEFQIIDSLKFFFDNIGRLMDPQYLATPQDYLYTRVRTSGVVTTTYNIKEVDFEMYDVGGQRNERRKWIHCFSDVTAVIFVAALSEYDQVLFEDSTTNRMKEALDLFEEICNLSYFRTSSIILFLNKKDLFVEKINTHPIASVDMWRGFKGGNNWKAGCDYFKDMFLERNKDPKRHVYYHVTTATDSSNVKFVFESCRDIILDQNIGESGL